MAQNFRRYTSNDVGTSAATLFTADSFDTVVGISVAKFTGSSAEGLGLFIPIKDALESLGVSIKN